MEHIVAKTIEELKWLLAHSSGGSVYVNENVAKEIKKLNGRDTERLVDELMFRGLRLKVKKKLNFIENIFNNVL